MSSDLYTLNRECRDLTRRIERLHQDVVYFGISGNFENKKFSSRLTPDNAEEKFNRVLEEYTNLSDRVTKGKYSSVSYQRLLGLVEISKKLTEEGYTATAICSYIRAVAKRHPKWSSIIN